MSEKADIFTAVVQEDGITRKIVFQRQPDGSYEVVRKPTERLRQDELRLSVKKSALAGTE